MYINATNIDEYIEQSYNSPLLVEIIKLVSQYFPEESPRFFDNGKSFSAIVFGRHPISTQGYEETGLINISIQKYSISIYFYNFTEDGNVFDKYTPLFPKRAAGRGCLRVTSENFIERYKDLVSQIMEEVVRIH